VRTSKRDAILTTATKYRYLFDISSVASRLRRRWRLSPRDVFVEHIFRSHRKVEIEKPLDGILA
jgi:hypothetical protein